MASQHQLLMTVTFQKGNGGRTFLRGAGCYIFARCWMLHFCEVLDVTFLRVAGCYISVRYWMLHFCEVLDVTFLRVAGCYISARYWM